MLKIAWTPQYCHPLPEGHRFPMEKYQILPDQLLFEGTILEHNLFQPVKARREDILLVHDEDYIKKLEKQQLTRQEERRTGFPLSKALVEREYIITQGTLEAVQYAFKHGIAMNIAGGTHHAYRNRGEGFCLFNDQSIGAAWLLKNTSISRILIVDLDVHQGNGTAAIFQHEPKVFTFSMHGEHNYPLKKEQSDLDIPLKDGIEDKEYLLLLEQHLDTITTQFEPQFIFYQAGVDVLSSDKLGRLGLSIQGCRERDRKVLEFCYQSDIPVVVSMGGGYSSRLADIIEAHANTYRLAQDIYF